MNNLNWFCRHPWRLSLTRSYRSVKTLVTGCARTSSIVNFKTMNWPMDILFGKEFNSFLNDVRQEKNRCFFTCRFPSWSPRWPGSSPGINKGRYYKNTSNNTPPLFHLKSNPFILKSSDISSMAECKICHSFKITNIETLITLNILLNYISRWVIFQ